MKTTLDLRRRRAFDLDGQQFSAGKREKKIHLGSVGGSIIVCLGSVWCCGDQCFNDKALPGLADDRMTEQSFLVRSEEPARFRWRFDNSVPRFRLVLR